MERKEFLRNVLVELHNDGNIDCTDYQGKDFDNLLFRCNQR